jgi:quercetin dioxygenase-like cupin family protein
MALKSVSTTLVLLTSLVALTAQQPAFKRTELQRGDLSVGREFVTVVAELPVGVATGAHTHFGEEIGYVLEGTISVQVAGKSPLTLSAGGAFLIPDGLRHDATNTGQSTAKILVNYVVEKGKPLATPAP